jgi:hypothetical protein
MPKKTPAPAMKPHTGKKQYKPSSPKIHTKARRTNEGVAKLEALGIWQKR